MKVFVLDAWGRLADCKKPDDHIPPHQGRGGLLVINFLAIDFYFLWWAQGQKWTTQLKLWAKVVFCTAR